MSSAETSVISANTQTDKEQIRQTEYFDTETPEARELRYQKQVELEKLIHERKLVGVPAKERVEFIRQFIFGQFPNVKGFNSVEVRHRGVEAFVRPWILSSKKFNYPSGYELPETLKHYYKILDQLSQQVAQIEDPHQKLQASKRLAAVAYSFGIMIHPFPDGNGQTLRMFSLSYLNEHSPDIYENARFPKRLKKTQSGGGAIHGKVEYDILKKKIPRLKGNKNLAMMVEFQTMPLPTSVEEVDEEDNHAVEQQQPTQRYWFSDEQSQMQRLYDIFYPFIPDLKMDSYASMTKQIHAAHERVSQQLSDVGITKNMASTVNMMRDVKDASSIDLVRQYLEYTLKSNRGSEWLTEYVVKGTTSSQEQIHPELRWVENIEYASLRSVEKQMSELLTNTVEDPKTVRKFRLIDLFQGRFNPK